MSKIDPPALRPLANNAVSGFSDHRQNRRPEKIWRTMLTLAPDNMEWLASPGDHPSSGSHPDSQETDLASKMIPN